jgi:hypothetical protein
MIVWAERNRSKSLSGEIPLSETNGKLTRSPKADPETQTHAVRWMAIVAIGIVVALAAFMGNALSSKTLTIESQQYLTIKEVQAQVLSLTGDQEEIGRAKEYLAEARRLYASHLDWPEDHPRIQECLQSAVDAAGKACTPKETHR